MGHGSNHGLRRVEDTPQVSHIALYQGEALIRVAGFYPLILEVLLEAVQNALDSDASKIWVGVNFKARRIFIRDNGSGVSRVKFEEALRSVCKSVKVSGKLGKFGMGMIAPLDKCDHFLFTSCAEGAEGYIEWKFEGEAIRKQAVLQGIPFRMRSDLVFAPDAGLTRSHGVTPVPWRTEVAIERFTDDVVISRVDIDKLETQIVDRYGVVMRARNVVVEVSMVNEAGEKSERTVRARDFTGLPLDEREFKSSEAGRTKVKLFVARSHPKKGRQGKVLVGATGDDFRLSFSQFDRSAGLLDSDVAAGLKSGVFEGEIIGEKISIAPNRRGFENNDALLGFCLAIAEWFKRYGRTHLAEAQSKAQATRYQELGLRSMKVLEGLLADPAYAYLREVMSLFRVGTVGPGHAKVARGKTTGEQDATSLAVQGKPGHPRESTGDSEGRERTKPDAAKADHHPMTVAGPQGKQRATVKSDSLGLQFSHEQFEGESRLWVLDVVNGVLRFNIRHPQWVACEGNDKALMRLQEFIAVTALTHLSMPDAIQGAARAFIDQQIEGYIFLLLQGDNLAGRKPGQVALKLVEDKK